MSNYTPLVNYAAKDALTTGNPSKKILGTEISAELSAIATAITSKEDTANKNLANGYLGLDANSQTSAAGYTVTGSTILANGIYLPSANTVGIATNSTQRATFGSSGLTLVGASSVLNLPRASDAATVGVVGSRSGGNISLYNGGGTTAEMIVTGGTAELWTNSTQRVAVTSGGAVTINTPASLATSLTISNASGGYCFNASGGAPSGAGLAYGYGVGLTGSAHNLVATSGTEPIAFGHMGNGPVRLYTNNALRLDIAAAGNVTINAPSSGAALTANGTTVVSNGAGSNFTMAFDGSGFYTDCTGTFTSHRIYTNNSLRVTVGSSGNVTIAAPVSGVGLTVSGGGATITGTVTGTTFSGSGSGLTGVPAAGVTGLAASATTDTTSASNISSGTLPTGRLSGSYTGITAVGNATANDSGGSPFDIGFRDMPQSTNTSLVLTDRGKHIYLTGTTNTVTIPANGSVAFPVGSTIVLVNDGSGNTTVNITTDTLAWLQGGAESTGSRTVATKSVVTLLKVTSTRWIISGSGIS